ncbi:recombinase family protein [Xanthobacter sp. 126]|uniref:recombinase family protein n=1 Tax=Xanthobacter sp. 126 TaxID=1131814 RepID=UPI00045E6ECC|nr:recombinase family protein [Xanthobacter sp. 126]
MRIGSACVSTDDHDLTRQCTALQVAGCERIFEEKGSGAVRTRPQIEAMPGRLRGGDVVR